MARHIGRVIKSVRVERALNTIGRMEKPPSRKGGEYRRSDVHASDPGDACGRRRGEEAYAPVAQWNRAPPSGGGRRRFESGRGHQRRNAATRMTPFPAGSRIGGDRHGAVAQRQRIPFATGRSRVRIPPAPPDGSSRGAPDKAPVRTDSHHALEKAMGGTVKAPMAQW